MKWLWFVLALIIAAAAVAGIYNLTDHYLVRTAPKSPFISCRQEKVEHIVIVQNNALNTTLVRGNLCDKLTIINKDARIRLMAFGKHDHHTAYDGVTEKVLGQDQSLSVVLDQLGTYTFHDHDDDAVKGGFIVQPE